MSLLFLNVNNHLLYAYARDIAWNKIMRKHKDIIKLLLVYAHFSVEMDKKIQVQMDETYNLAIQQIDNR